MDRPSQTHLYAGLLVYRSLRNIEFLLLNDSFTNKKHWFCPKGLVLGQEDELKCALRETFEATGLGPHLLRIEEGFKIQLRYLSGTKPKKVVYYLAQLVDNHARLLANAEGVHLQWCNQQVASEKAVFKSMQDVFYHAQSFIETKKPNRYQPQYNGKRNTSGQHLKGKSRNGETSPTANNENQYNGLRQSRPSSAPILRSSPSPPQPSSAFHQVTEDTHASNPLFKTRLCERFETDGECPYGPRCTFAHGIQELRSKESHGTPSVGSSSDEDERKENAKDVTENPLYKTKLCDRFMKDQFCQYGPKCHFAHGRSELKERPNYHHHHHHSQQNQLTEDAITTSDIANNATQPHDVGKKVEAKENETKEKEPKDTTTHPWRMASAKVDPAEVKPVAPELRSPLPDVADLNLNKHRRQQKAEHQIQHNVRPSPPQHGTQHQTLVNPTPTKKRPSSSDPVLNGDITQTDKSWMKVVHLSKEEQVKLAMPPVTKTPSPTPSKVVQEEAIIGELTTFFQSPESAQQQKQQTTQHLLAKDVKQVTKVEMRNDLTKAQLFYILLASLLQNSAECPVGTILRSREHLFKTFVKSTTDQRILLKAWDRCVQRYPLLLPKSSLVLSQWYECDLLDEDACYVWFDGLDSNGELKKKIAKFIDWLKTADEEDDD